MDGDGATTVEGLRHRFAESLDAFLLGRGWDESEEPEDDIEDVLRALGIDASVGGDQTEHDGDREPDSVVYARYAREYPDGVRGEVLVSEEQVDGGRRAPPEQPVRVSARLGVFYPPAEKLLRVATSTGPLGLFHDLAELLARPEDALCRFLTVDDAEQAALRLDGLIEAQRISFIETKASLDALVHAAQQEGELALATAVLAVAGRYDEASTVLRDFVARARRDSSGRDDRRVARQLGRWIDSRTRSGPPWRDPSSPPVWIDRGARRPHVGFVETYRQHRARDEAFKKLQRSGQRLDRDGWRRALVGELDARGLSESPLWIELRLDELEKGTVPPSGLFGNLKGLAKLAEVAVPFARQLGAAVKGTPTPDWLEPPDRAGYPARFLRGEHVAVSLDTSALAWLRRVLDACARSGKFANVDAWLSWENNSDSPGSALVVHLGSERVGLLDNQASDRLRPVMSAALERDELPWLTARLTALAASVPFLLEVSLPSSPG